MTDRPTMSSVAASLSGRASDPLDLQQDRPCPSCGEMMELVKVLWAVEGHDELRTYRCKRCGAVLTIPIRRPRPER